MAEDHVHQISREADRQAHPPAAQPVDHATTHEAQHAGHGSHHEAALKRLRSAEGHLRGIQRMVEEDAYCIEIIHQIQAVQAALAKISVQILDEHLNTCVLTAVRGDDPVERERVLKEISDVFEMAAKAVPTAKD